MLSKNQTVTEHNKTLLVETLRSMSEMLIWGDQNDSSVFEYVVVTVVVVLVVSVLFSLKSTMSHSGFRVGSQNVLLLP